MDEAIRSAQVATVFVRNHCVRLWMDTPSTSANGLQALCSQAYWLSFTARV